MKTQKRLSYYYVYYNKQIVCKNKALISLTKGNDEL